MDQAELKHFGTPDEVREFPKGRLELIKVGGATVGRAVLEPGWHWAESIQPIVGWRYPCARKAVAVTSVSSSWSRAWRISATISACGKLVRAGETRSRTSCTDGS